MSAEKNELTFEFLDRANRRLEALSSTFDLHLAPSISWTTGPLDSPVSKYEEALDLVFETYGKRGFPLDPLPPFLRRQCDVQTALFPMMLYNRDRYAMLLYSVWANAVVWDRQSRNAKELPDPWIWNMTPLEKSHAVALRDALLQEYATSLADCSSWVEASGFLRYRDRSKDADKVDRAHACLEKLQDVLRLKQEFSKLQRTSNSLRVQKNILAVIERIQREKQPEDDALDVPKSEKFSADKANEEEEKEEEKALADLTDLWTEHTNPEDLNDWKLLLKSETVSKLLKQFSNPTSDDDFDSDLDSDEESGSNGSQEN